jgi:hypothetical protein
MTKTNETTRLILEYLFQKGCYAWRNSIGAIQSKGHFYSMGLTGSSDIFAIFPPNGRFIGIEIKTGKDKLRPEQVGFIKNCQHVGADVLVVKDFEDFKNQLSTFDTK